MMHMLSYSFSSKYAEITSSLFLIVFHEYTEYAFRMQIYMDSCKTVKQSSRVEAVFEGENLCVLFLQPPTQLTKWFSQLSIQLIIHHSSLNTNAPPTPTEPSRRGLDPRPVWGLFHAAHRSSVQAMQQQTG